MVKKYGYFDHKCELPTPSETCLLDIPPYLSKSKKWLRSLRRFILVDENSARTKDFFRSYAAVMAEKRRHARNYHQTIHPYSIFAVYRERILCFMWLVCFITDPITWSFSIFRTVGHPVFIVQSVLDGLFFINLIVTCFIGYCVSVPKEIILCPKKIFKKRALTYVLPEFIACFPIVILVDEFTDVDLKNSRLHVLFFIKILRILRIFDLFHYMGNLFHELHFREWVYTWVVLLISNIYCVLWSTCALFFINVTVYTYDGLPKNSFLRNRAPVGSGDPGYQGVGTEILEPWNSFHNTFVQLLTTACCHFYGASEGYVPVDLELEKILCSFIMIFGYCLCTFITAKLLEIVGSSNISETKYDELINQVSEYARSKNLPDKLKKRLSVYHEYKFHRRFFKEEVILATLSDHLRSEVIIYGCRNVMEKVPLFQGMPKGVLGSIIGYMKKQIYLPNDVVLKYGEPLTRMFWVSFGTLSVYYGPNVVEILHFEDGDHFGDLSITKEGGNALLTVVALEITEIFTLSRKDVKHCTAFLKEMSERIHRINIEKKRLYPRLAEMMSDQGPHNTVLRDLRKGRILERDRWRKV